jgi:acetolactate synthase-1/2/3 large subunit
VLISRLSRSAADDTLRDALSQAAAILIVGGSRWDEPGWRSLQAFAEANDLPVAASFRRQTGSTTTILLCRGTRGSPESKLRRRVQDADLLILLGGRLGEMATGGYTLIDAPKPRQKLIHIHAGAGELGRVYQADLSINATPRGFSALLDGLQPIERPRWAAGEPRRAQNTRSGKFHDWCRADPDGRGHRPAARAIAAGGDHHHGAGNFATWAHRYHRYRRLGSSWRRRAGPWDTEFRPRLRQAPPPASSGRLYRRDGDFMMTGQELSTAMQYVPPSWCNPG